MSCIVTKQLMYFGLEKGDDYIPNIITFYHNGYWEKNVLGGVRANFYYVMVPTNEFNPVFELPHNFQPINLLDINVRYDAILCTNKMVNYQEAASLSHQLHCPLIVYEHSYRPDHVGRLQASHYKGQIANFHIFSHEEIARSWGYGPDECLVIEPYTSKPENPKNKRGVLIFGQNVRTPQEIDVVQRLQQMIPNSIAIDRTVNEAKTVELIANHEFIIDIVNSFDIPWEIECAIDYNTYVITNHSPILDVLVTPEKGRLINDYSEVLPIIRRKPTLNTKSPQEKNPSGSMENVIRECLYIGYRR